MRQKTLIAAADHSRINAAVGNAERLSDGEIATMVARQSDDYAEWAMLLAALAGLIAPAILALFPDRFTSAMVALNGGWRTAPTIGEALALGASIGAIAFVATWLVLRWMPLRLALVPGIVKQGRVRAAAIRAFRIGIEARTRAATGVLIYLSLAERRADIVADSAIAGKVGDDAWGEAMALLLTDVRAKRPADGIIAAVGAIGALIALHFPHSADDTNELPDRLIEL